MRIPRFHFGRSRPISVLYVGLGLLLAACPEFAREVPPPTPAAAAKAVIADSGQLYSITGPDWNRPHRAEIDIVADYYDPYWKLLWGHDRNGFSYFALENASPVLKSGQRFHFSGDFVPAKGFPLATGKLTILPDVPPPVPVPIRGNILDAAHLNAHVVTAEGYVNSQSEADPEHLQIDLAIEGQPVTARVLIAADSPIPQVQGAFVRITGVYVAGGGGDSVQLNLWVPRAAGIEIVGWLDRDQRFALPLTSIDDLPTASVDELVHVSGEVRSQKRGVDVVLRDQTGQLTLLTAMTRPLKVGERIEAIGYPKTDGITTVLRQSLYRPAAAPASPPPARGLPLLRLAQQVRELNFDEATKNYSARLKGLVTWSQPGNRLIFLLDASGSVEVTLPPGTADAPPVGSLVAVTGHTALRGFAPELIADSMQVSDGAKIPAPPHVTLEQAMTGVEESQWIHMSGFVRAVQAGTTQTRLTISTSSGEFTALVPRSQRIDALAGAVVQLQGVCRALTDDNRQLTGIELWVPTVDDVVVDQTQPADLFAEPQRSIASLRRFNAIDAFNRRVRVAGVVLHQERGAYLNLQENDQSLMVLSRDNTPARPGDRVEAVGFPGRQGRRLVLRESTFRVTGRAREPAPIALTHPEVLRPDLDGRLVRVETFVSDVSHQAGSFRVVCQSGATVFEAVAHRDEGNLLRDLDRGCIASLTGVYLVQSEQSAAPQAFRLLLRSAADIVVLQPPPWWTASRVKSLVASLAAAILLGLTWVFALRRRVRHQTAQIRSQLEKAERLEAELVHSSKLESLGILAGGIAHDFNNLLGVILGNLSLVLGERTLDAEHERFLRQGERAAFRARDLTQQLLTFAKGGAPVRASVALPEVVREAAGFALHGAKVRAEFDFAADPWPGHIDRGQISQVVHNIVLNASHAMPAGGVVRVTLRNETVEAGASVPLPPGPYLLLDIRDHGSGISPEHLSRIFDPYFTTKRQGNGLGLASAYSIVKKHSGHIDVESRLGKGTTFHIWLPAAAADPARPAARPEATPRLAGRALIMDDEAAVRDLAGAMLRRLGLEVTAAIDGEHAIEAYRAALAAQRPFSVMIVDLTVPGAMGGLEAVGELRKIDPDIRAIVSSGYSNDPVLSDYRRYGFVGRIPKPYKFDQFAETIAAVINNVPALPT